MVVCDNNVIADIIQGLNGLTEKPLTKGAKRFWQSYLIISFDQFYNANSKDKNKAAFEVYEERTQNPENAEVDIFVAVG